jgi:tRNA (cmo5U34)-methyltransferase
MKKDRIFAKKMDKIHNFSFGEKTAEVFDDMLSRSVPLYYELQRMIVELTAGFAKDGTNIYDLGCSTGNTLLSLDKKIDRKVKFIGIDYSVPLLNKCKKRFKRFNFKHSYELICTDLNEPIKITNASVVIMNLTLQFIRPSKRDNLIKSIYNGLNHRGCFILVEKILNNCPIFDRIFVQFYHDMKRKNGYSELEIIQKDKALKKILKPYSLNKNKQLLLRKGFYYFDIFFKWYNFCGMVAIK